ncbi:hypothetical protein STCU_11179 [Strigomonas culicis]|uniref:Uncharacterized protein n=1 Tax=Strigomonas culicis TaxID=28005 RepID=S9TEP6_9TRYP|nr:hypothetical protein STCU_11179 [Strigomonas culicis]|eukprot:EPY16517.1 hypothetical protein STCU_11179 [Strigomonas culicis]
MQCSLIHDKHLNASASEEDADDGRGHQRTIDLLAQEALRRQYALYEKDAILSRFRQMLKEEGEGEGEGEGVEGNQEKNDTEDRDKETQ